MEISLKVIFTVIVFAFIECEKCQAVLNLNEGDACLEGGVCRPLRACPEARRGLRNRVNPEICKYLARNAVVCCVSSGNSENITGNEPARPGLAFETQGPRQEAAPVSTTDHPAGTPSRRVSLPRPAPPPGAARAPVNRPLSEIPPACKPRAEDVRVNRTDSKAWNKCIDMTTYVYGCKKTPSFVGPIWTRQDYCLKAGLPMVVGGTVAGPNEFPHMALLGYGKKNNESYECGGSLISERFVLTAAHCAFSRMQQSKAKVVWLGSHRRSQAGAASDLYSVQEFLKHPQYSRAAKTNDIALVKLTTEVEFNWRVRPACLHTTEAVPANHVFATGWGLTSDLGEASDDLMKVQLEVFPHDECVEELFDSDEDTSIHEKYQICAGSHKSSKDTCQGDSGGPLQFSSPNLFCMHSIVGVTSYGKMCGKAGKPAVYTRVAAYVPWLESLVWPESS